MPTKINHAGEQQNYVPAGNGDASGEYGDNATGSNKHFTSFKKPTEQQGKNFTKYKLTDKTGYVTYIDDEEIYNELSNDKNFLKSNKIEKINFNTEKDYQKELFNNVLQRTLNNANNRLDFYTLQDFNRELNTNAKLDNISKENLEEFMSSLEVEKTRINFCKNKINNSIKNNTAKGKNNVKNMQDVVNNIENIPSSVLSSYANVFNDNVINLVKNGKDCVYVNSGAIYLSNSAFGEDDNYYKGEVFLHEGGHSIDYSYKNGGCWSNNYISKTNGKTLTDTINYELQPFLQDFKYNELKTEIDNYLSEQEQILKNKHEQKQNELKNIYKEYISIQDEILNNNNEYKTLKDRNLILQQNNKMFSSEYTDNLHKMWAISDNIKNTNEYKDAIKKFDKDPMEKIIEEGDNYLKEKLKLNAQKFKKYGGISDMIQAVTEKQTNKSKKLCGGHDIGYFNKNKENQGAEAFAEIISSKYTNKESYDLMKKYIPQTLKVFDEIEKELYNYEEK